MFSRRGFLKSSGLAFFAATVGGAPLFLSRTAQAAAPPALYGRRKVLVGIFQRGAMDGLMAVQPFTDPLLPQYRPQLAMSAAQAAGDARLLDLDGRYGLHPAFAPFERLFREGRLGILHGVGSPNTTRSHFDAQDYMEYGTPGRKGGSGWLNRAVGLLGHEPTPFQAVALSPSMPLALTGPHPAISIGDLADFNLHTPGAAGMASAVGQSLEALYAQTTGELLGQTGRETLEAARILSPDQVRSYRPAHGAVYPPSPLGQSLQQIAQLIKLDVGLEVAFTESTGWDTHVRQGAAQGSFATRARDLATSIAAFWTDLERYHDDVTLLTMTEFGRTVAQNGSAGTDHGRASCLFVLGNNVAGGRVHGQPLRLDRDALADGRDLAVTTDFRAAFAGIAGPHLGITDDATLFPGWSGGRAALLRR